MFNAKDATFNAFNVPFFWLPRVGGSMTDRGSALRDIQFGGASGFGPSIRTRWGLFESLGQSAPQGLDASYRLDYYGDRGPGTGDPAHMIENLGGGRGRLPSPEHIQRMVRLVDALPNG